MVTIDTAQPRVTTLGNMAVYRDGYSVYIDGKRVELSGREFELLSILIDNLDRVVPFGELLRAMWSIDDGRHRRHLNVQMHYLRQKLADSYPWEIKTVRLRGYGLVNAEFSVPAND